MTYVEQAVKTITKATPTVDVDGKVVKWEIEVSYSLNDYTSTYRSEATVNDNKELASYTKADLWALINETHLDTVYESQYISTQIPEEVTETKVDDFDVTSLS